MYKRLSPGAIHLPCLRVGPPVRSTVPPPTTYLFCPNALSSCKQWEPSRGAIGCTLAVANTTEAFARGRVVLDAAKESQTSGRLRTTKNAAGQGPTPKLICCLVPAHAAVREPWYSTSELARIGPATRAIDAQSCQRIIAPMLPFLVHVADCSRKVQSAMPRDAEKAEVQVEARRYWLS